LEEILTHNFFRYRGWCKAFLYLLIGDSGAPLKQGRIQGAIWAIAHHKTYESNIFHHDFVQFRITLDCQRRLDCEILLKSPTPELTSWIRPCFEGIVLTHYNCCQGSIWKDVTYTLQLLLVAPSKSRYLRTEVAVWVPFDSIELAYCSCCWWPLWKQGTYTLQLLLGASLKARNFTLQ